MRGLLWRNMALKPKATQSYEEVVKQDQEETWSQPQQDPVVERCPSIILSGTEKYRNDPAFQRADVKRLARRPDELTAAPSSRGAPLRLQIRHGRRNKSWEDLMSGRAALAIVALLYVRCASTEKLTRSPLPLNRDCQAV